MRWREGQQVATHVRLIRCLEEDAHAALWVAEDRQTRRQLWIRWWKAPLRPNLVRQVKDEIKALVAIKHPAIARVHGLIEDGMATGIMLEPLLGSTLAAELKRGPIASPQDLLLALAEALDQLHQGGLVHGALSPASVRIGEPNPPAVRLYGFSIGPDAAQALPPPYLAPECAGGAPPTAAADRYAFAVIAAEVLSGRSFEAASAALSEAARAALAPGLSPDPKARPARARSLVEALFGLPAPAAALGPSLVPPPLPPKLPVASPELAPTVRDTPLAPPPTLSPLAMDLLDGPTVPIAPLPIAAPTPVVEASTVEIPAPPPVPSEGPTEAIRPAPLLEIGKKAPPAPPEPTTVPIPKVETPPPPRAVIPGLAALRRLARPSASGRTPSGRHAGIERAVFGLLGLAFAGAAYFLADDPESAALGAVGVAAGWLAAVVVLILRADSRVAEATKILGKAGSIRLRELDRGRLLGVSSTLSGATGALAEATRLEWLRGWRAGVRVAGQPIRLRLRLPEAAAEQLERGARTVSLPEVTENTLGALRCSESTAAGVRKALERLRRLGGQEALLEDGHLAVELRLQGRAARTVAKSAEESVLALLIVVGLLLEAER
ncbi:MAG: protein kinase [Myxococcota bacterium]